jgi:double-stranded uracil-DNA glycosylase
VVTAPELAGRLQVDAKRLRAWLRACAAAGHPLLASHEHNQPYWFTEREARQLQREFRGELRTSRHGSPRKTKQPGGSSASTARQAHLTPTVRKASPGAPGATSRTYDRHTLRDKHGHVLSLSEDPGHRITDDWMGQTVLTLEDLLRPGLRAVAVGINPAPLSVARGHYWQGFLGQRFLRRLRHVGLIETSEDGREDDAAFAAGVGFTDVIKRPTRSAKELCGDEYKHGRKAVVDRVERYCPELVVFAFKPAAVAVFEQRFDGNGFVPGLRLGRSDVFVMPGSMEDRHTAGETLAALAEYVGGMG